MSVAYSRSHRRRIEVAAEAAKRMTDADARYFARFPLRNHRIRLTSRAELDANAAVAGVPSIKTESGYRWFTAVKQIAPGVRTRLFVQNGSDVDPEMDEGAARQVYEYLARTGGTRALAIEARLRTVMKDQCRS